MPPLVISSIFGDTVGTLGEKRGSLTKSAFNDNSTYTNSLLQQISSLQQQLALSESGKWSDMQQLTYLRWVNACLRFELVRYVKEAEEAGTEAGAEDDETKKFGNSALDLSSSFDPRSHNLARALLQKYSDERKAEECGEDDDDDALLASPDSGSGSEKKKKKKKGRKSAFGSLKKLAFWKSSSSSGPEEDDWSGDGELSIGAPQDFKHTLHIGQEHLPAGPRKRAGSKFGGRPSILVEMASQLGSCTYDDLPFYALLWGAVPL
ncbi:hypothetical protein CYMTET_31872 [Cymbomonas tetramitiformis]|uniref:CRIB domain-containing protein n=1 Tax=Cymbomonas tetramitiformis TaxID=36881 RepID=A0AAE0FG70_9CHLO|nr:hypothetical protein CYMTET_31872 [Cymbomonas tetramitiformis]